MKTNKLVLVDGDNLLYRAYFKFGNLTDENGRASGIIFGFPYILRSSLVRLKPDKVVAVFDGGKSIHRLSLLPNYKQREQKLGFDPDSFHAQKEEIKHLLQFMGCHVICGKGLEADDLIYHVVKHHPDWGTTLISADKDFHQMLGPKFSIWSPAKSLLLTPKNVERYFPYNPETCVDYLCLIGDDSDKIPGIPSVGPVRAAKFLYTYGSIAQFLRMPKENPFPQLGRDQTIAILKRNRKLINLSYHYNIFGRKVQLPYLNYKANFNMVEIAKVSRKYNCNTLVKTDFIETFKNLV